jgi:nickel/cobalt exporter
MNNYFKSLFYLLIVLLVMGIFVSPVKGQNPFSGQIEPDMTESQQRLSQTLLDKLTLWQNQVREKIAALVKESKQTHSLRPLAALILLALAYGILHAAGPGHGKAVAVSYILSHRPNYLKGLIFGNLIALFHGAGGIAFIMLVYGILHVGVFKSMAQINYITQIVSYSLIICLGLFLLGSVVWEWCKKRQPLFGQKLEISIGKNTAAALIIGIIPCPGVIMVTLLAVSMGLPTLGILLGICITIGMTVTISAVVILGMAGKKILIKRLESMPGRAQTFEKAIRGISGLLVTTLGIFLLVSTMISGVKL